MAKISIPFNLESPAMEQKMEEKEIKAKEHLEEMCEITRQLSYNDITLLKKGFSGRAKIKEENELQNEKENKFREY